VIDLSSYESIDVPHTDTSPDDKSGLKEILITLAAGLAIMAIAAALFLYLLACWGTNITGICHHLSKKNILTKINRLSGFGILTPDDTYVGGLVGVIVAIVLIVLIFSSASYVRRKYSWDHLVVDGERPRYGPSYGKYNVFGL
jgi:hypothetical protein